MPESFAHRLSRTFTRGTMDWDGESEAGERRVEDQPHVQVSLNDRTANKERGFVDNYLTTTKYTKLNFIPLSLMSQFTTRFANVYFLLVVVVSVGFPDATPINPITSILPLIFVLLVSMLKEGYEDFKRHQADKLSNEQLYSVQQGTENFEFSEIMSRDIFPGDVVCVQQGQSIPADLLLLASSEAEGSCYVETSNLDGETNLKLHKALPQTAVWNTAEALKAVRGVVVTAEAANEHLHKFLGVIKIDGTDHSLSQKQLLLRGAQLRNTKFAYGMVVYAGTDTKLHLNAQPGKLKYSSMERTLNRLVIAYFGIILAIIFVMAIGANVFQSSDGNKMDVYMDSVARNSATGTGMSAVLTYFILTSFMIPISLYVTIELVRIGQKFFFEWDGRLYDQEVDNTGKLRNTLLNEELAMVQFVFSDKTGTLTENKMELAKVFVPPGQTYQLLALEESGIPGASDAAASASSSSSFGSTASLPVVAAANVAADALAKVAQSTSAAGDVKEATRQFLKCLALCHNVVPEADDTGKMVYQAQSPDEGALVLAAKNNGCTLLSTNSGKYSLDLFGTKLDYELLVTVEFSADRRRMSILFRDPEGRVVLFTKGADVVMKNLLSKDQLATHWASADAQLEAYSREGLRTLVCAYRVVPEDEYKNWYENTWTTAVNSLRDRNDNIAGAADVIEKDMTLAGVTAIEDKLQHEVPKTIKEILDAHVGLWVLTGDKQETAINIGYSSGIIGRDFHLNIFNVLSQNQVEEELDRLVGHSKDHAKFALVVDGVTLNYTLQNPAATEKFLQFALACESVICCRTTPMQKAYVVREVRRRFQKTTLAIGDGANDVSMILEADVGVGIQGREGTQAARSSDFSITKFKHLRRIMFVHGRYSYVRLTGLILYSFYKNLAFTGTSIWFSFVNGFSGQTLHDQWILSFFNIFFTSIPPLLYGLFEKDIEPDLIEANPKVFHTIRRDHPFDAGQFLKNLSLATYHSLIIFLFSFYAQESASAAVNSDGVTGGMWFSSVYQSSVGICVVLTKMFLITRSHTALSLGGLAFSIIFFFFFNVVYAGVQFVFKESTMFNVFTMAISTSTYWLGVLVIPFFAVLPDIVMEYLSYYSPPYYRRLYMDQQGLVDRKGCFGLIKPS